MTEKPNWEERCALALRELDRPDIDAARKLDHVRSILTGKTPPPHGVSKSTGAGAHEWVEVGVEPLGDAEDTTEGQSIRYACRKCNAKGYRIVFPTSVTLYPIVSDVLACER
ncbi:MAG: hypothetical protein QM784_25070 [Polyangiaceae bacterium]